MFEMNTSNEVALKISQKNFILKINLKLELINKIHFQMSFLFALVVVNQICSYKKIKAAAL